MMLELWELRWAEALCSVFLLAVGFVFFYHLFRLLPAGSRRIRPFRFGEAVGRRAPPKWLMNLFMANHYNSDKLQELEQHLLGAGIALMGIWYVVCKRLAAVILLMTAGLGYMASRNGYAPFGVAPLYMYLGAACGLAFLLFDRWWLESLRKHRSNRIVEEMYTLSNQLLYFAGSRLNLHTKLIRCLPYTRTIRGAWHQLLNEWYQDAGEALAAFRQRLGTDEAYSFTETLNTMRLHEDEAYYELLRQRIQDYKEKLELVRESRKESVSYLLFVLAGMPILYTFRIFIYPWVEEGKRLFQTLN